MVRWRTKPFLTVVNVTYIGNPKPILDRGWTLKCALQAIPGFHPSGALRATKSFAEEFLTTLKRLAYPELRLPR